jgi:hypothetical protein
MTSQGKVLVRVVKVFIFYGLMNGMFHLITFMG